ncbi:chromosome condensation protein [Micromonospora sp. KC207]|uniref:phthiocerol/phthiodiolone dimycocerosyl transferase family protein n=1 Tax=Micromonospora sp. KC207 TaxID=2530377 RepID=UPI00104BE5A7|nr:chromosome condensation protein [Micromonospora sp. KC207]TDC49147.1 chromosome condensation protein [Micromonospora sp. KC207]
MTIERRSLTLFESLFYMRQVGPVVASLTLEGQVDAAALDRAVRLLQRDYPLLRCSFRRTDDDVALVLADEVPGLTVVPAGWNLLTNELNVPLDQDRRLSRISLSQAAGSAVLTLANDHAGSDARLNTLLLHRLLEYYTDLLRGIEPPPTGRSAFEGSLEEALLAAYEPGPVQPPPDTDPPMTLAGAATAPGPLGVRSLSYEQDTTAALIAASRRGGVSLTNLLTGAMACAVRAQFPDAGPLPVSAAVVVDLRPRVNPPIAPDALFCCAARLVCATHVDAADKPVEVGRRIGTQLKAALEQEEIQHRLVAQRGVGKPTPLPPISFMVSNIGIVEDYPVPDGLRIIDSRFATTSRGPVPTLFGSTANGRLTLDLVYDTAFHRADVIDEVVKHFEASLLGSEH